MGTEEIEVLRTSGTMPTMLPGAAFFLEMPYPPARAMIEGGLSVALASDFNPGSSPSGSMKMIVSLACIKMRMTPAEAINAATLNGAYAMGLSSEYGSITVGKKRTSSSRRRFLRWHICRMPIPLRLSTGYSSGGKR